MSQEAPLTQDQAELEQTPPQEAQLTLDGLGREVEAAHQQVMAETPNRRTITVDASGVVLTERETVKAHEEGAPEGAYKNGQR